MNTRVSDRLLVLAAAALFSTGGAAIKSNELSAWQVAGFRSLIAAVTLIVLVPGARRWSWRLVPAGVAYAAVLLLFVTANKLTTAANAIFLQGTAPLYLLFLGPLLLREPLHRTDVWLMLAIAAGMAMFFAGSERAVGTAPDPFTGNVLGAFSGLAWALTVLSLRYLGRGRHGNDAPIASVALGNFLAFTIALPLALPVRDVAMRDVLVLLYLGAFQVGLAYWCLTRAMRRVPAFEASTLILLEPALNPVWTWLLLGERPGGFAIAGGAVILSATLAHTWLKLRQRADTPTARQEVDRQAYDEPRKKQEPRLER